MLLTLALVSSASAQVLWTQGFESNTTGWFDDSDDGWSGYGSITAVSSGGGNLGLTASAGSAYAEVTQGSVLQNLAGGLSNYVGPQSNFGGYSNTWPGGLTASLDVYLDTTWSAGEGFDYSVAINGSDGEHLRDFIFHVTMDTSTGSLLIGGSNNTNFDPKQNLENGDYYTVTASGWYTFEHVFREADDGSLAVDLNLRSASGSLLYFTTTRNNPADLIASVVGGNRYAWLTNIDIAEGLAIDNQSLQVSAVPEPATTAAIGGVLCLGFAFLRRRRLRAHAPA